MRNCKVREAEGLEEGAGARVLRLFPVRGLMNFDPFVLWDHFAVAPGTGFPEHPHRGFEGLTYIFEGGMQHRDNLGNTACVRGGGLQRFTAGRGILHSEMPVGDTPVRGIQLWVNLPARLKGCGPAYQQVEAGAVPVIEHDGVRMRVLVGEDSPLRLQTAVRYLDVSLEPGVVFDEVPARDFRGLLYAVEGELEFDGGRLTAGQAVLCEAGEFTGIKAAAASRFMLCFGRPHGEPIRQHGPFVD